MADKDENPALFAGSKSKKATHTAAEIKENPALFAGKTAKKDGDVEDDDDTGGEAGTE